MSTNKVRIRIGFKTFFPNMAIFVVYMPADKADALIYSMESAKAMLYSAGYDDIARRIVAERS